MGNRGGRIFPLTFAGGMSIYEGASELLSGIVFSTRSLSDVEPLARSKRGLVENFADLSPDGMGRP